MAASSSSASRLWSYDVFPSFSGEDVRKTFLSHVLNEFQRKGIRTFVDNRIKRGESIAPELVGAIRESRIAIVILSKKYASSSWCLNELLEIMNCKATNAQRVMTVFYDVDPADVRKQTGDFGLAFEITCNSRTSDEKQRWSQALIERWSQALTDVSNILGVHSKMWPSEADMILKIATDVCDVLNSTPSRDFDNFVGIDAHLAKMNSLLCLENNEVRMIGIWGPAGIGKSTIARELYNRFSSNFQLTLFMENVKESYRRNGPDSYISKLRLQERLLAELLDHKDLRIDNLGVADKRLRYQKVIIILDDVDKIEQLDALADQAQWFGNGSRIIVTAEHKDLLVAHGINHIYEVGFPSDLEALQIFSLSAFKQDSPPEEYEELALEVAKLTKLPLGLSVLGSSLRGKNKSWWIRALPSLKTTLHEDIEKILKVGYDSLGNDKYKAIFLHIACLFNGQRKDRVIRLLKSSGLDIELGLDVLVERALIYISSHQCVIMHHLLQQMGQEVVRRQSTHEPGKRQFLVEAKDIYDVFADNTGTGTIVGISFNMSEINELFLGEEAFSGMHNLQFLRFYRNLWDNKARLHLDADLACLPLPRKLRLLHWEACPMKCMPRRFSWEFLVEIIMLDSKLEKLWEGAPMLRCLKRIFLSNSIYLEEVPDLSNAANLEILGLASCRSLVTLPSSIGELKKLISLRLSGCSNLESLPANVTLESLTSLTIENCIALKDFPEFSSKFKILNISFSAIREVPQSVQHWSRLEELNLTSCENVTAFPPVPGTVEKLYLDHSGITEIPEWIENIYALRILSMKYCKQLLDISPKICKLKRLHTLDFKGCCNVSRFPVEIFQSFCCSNELSLNLENISWNSLPTDTHERAHTFRLQLFMGENDFQNIPVSFKRLSKLRALHFDDSKKLQVLPELPDSMEELTANNCVSLERISDSSHSSHIPKLVLCFINCSKLNQEARRLLIEQWSCGYAILPGSQVPNYFTHQARGSSLTIHLDPMRSCGFLRFKACVVLPYDELTSDIIQIWCSIRGEEGFIYEWPRIHDIHDPVVDHLVIFNSYYNLEESMISDNKVVFNFRCYPAMILQCGIKLMEPCPCEHNIMGHPVLRIRPLNGWISFLYRLTFHEYGTDSSGECVSDRNVDTDDETEDSQDSGDGDLGKDYEIEDINESRDGDVVMGEGTEDNEELGFSDLETRSSRKRKRLISGEKQERPRKKMRRI